MFLLGIIRFWNTHKWTASQHKRCSTCSLCWLLSCDSRFGSTRYKSRQRLIAPGTMISSATPSGEGFRLFYKCAERRGTGLSGNPAEEMSRKGDTSWFIPERTRREAYIWIGLKTACTSIGAVSSVPSYRYCTWSPNIHALFRFSQGFRVCSAPKVAASDHELEPPAMLGREQA
jgi:hypothetical protein